MCHGPSQRSSWITLHFLLSDQPFFKLETLHHQLLIKIDEWWDVLFSFKLAPVPTLPYDQYFYMTHFEFVYLYIQRHRAKWVICCEYWFWVIFKCNVKFLLHFIVFSYMELSISLKSFFNCFLLENSNPRLPNKQLNEFLIAWKGISRINTHKIHYPYTRSEMERNKYYKRWVGGWSDSTCSPIPL